MHTLFVQLEKQIDVPRNLQKAYKVVSLQYCSGRDTDDDFLFAIQPGYMTNKLSIVAAEISLSKTKSWFLFPR